MANDGFGYSLLESVGENGEARRTRATAPSSGVQPIQFLREFIRTNVILAAHPILPEQIQPASVDLRLGSAAYRVRASFLPSPSQTVMAKVEAMDGYRIDLSGPNGAVLDKGQVYVIPLQEGLRLPDAIQGFANPKSSTGRLDVLTRLITEQGESFDHIRSGYQGPLFVEVAPQTFSVVVRTGTTLNQIRLLRGSPGTGWGQGELRRRYHDGEFVRPFDKKQMLRDNLVPVRIDLMGTGPGSIIGYRAKPYTDRIDLTARGYDPEDYWEPLYYREGKDATLTLTPGDFYILATIEDVRVPDDCAAEMVAYHTRAGEYRVHYAGFFDPGFGCDPSGQGSKAVLEVRSLEIPFILEHGQPVGWLKYEKLADKPERVYGGGIGSNYQNQALALAKQFRPFPQPGARPSAAPLGQK